MGVPKSELYGIEVLALAQSANIPAFCRSNDPGATRRSVQFTLTRGANGFSDSVTFKVITESLPVGRESSNGSDATVPFNTHSKKRIGKSAQTMSLRSSWFVRYPSISHETWNAPRPRNSPGPQTTRERRPWNCVASNWNGNIFGWKRWRRRLPLRASSFRDRRFGACKMKRPWPATIRCRRNNESVRCWLRVLVRLETNSLSLDCDFSA